MADELCPLVIHHKLRYKICNTYTATPKLNHLQAIVGHTIHNKQFNAAKPIVQAIILV